MYTGKFLSANGVNDVFYYIYGENLESPKAVVQISHGMMDYIKKYEDLIKFLNKNNIVVCGCDDLGHGETGKNSKFGFFSNKKGYRHVLNDLHKTTQIVKEKYKNLPFFLVGHSMGSFFARLYAYKFPQELDGLILLGTSGKVNGTALGLLILDALMLFKGKKGYLKFLEKLANKSYFKYINNPTSGREWVTSRQDILEFYKNDPKSNFSFSLSAYHDMLKVLKFISSNKWYKDIDKDIPILLASGSHDPVGQYGKGVAEVYTKLEKCGQKDVQLKLYAKARHELHNEQKHITKQFFDDTLNWIEERIKDK